MLLTKSTVNYALNIYMSIYFRVNILQKLYVTRIHVLGTEKEFVLGS